MHKMDISEIRRKNAKYLSTLIGGINAFAEKMEKGQPQISCLIGKKPSRNIGNKIAREIEKKFNLEKDWLDLAHPELWKEDRVTIIPIKQEISENPEELTAEAIKFAKAWQELPPEQKNTLAAFVYATQKPIQKVA